MLKKSANYWSFYLKNSQAESFTISSLRFLLALRYGY